MESSSSEVELDDLSEVFPPLLMDVLIHIDTDSLGVTRSGDRMGMVTLEFIVAVTLSIPSAE